MIYRYISYAVNDLYKASLSLLASLYRFSLPFIRYITPGSVDKKHNRQPSNYLNSLFTYTRLCFVFFFIRFSLSFSSSFCSEHLFRFPSVGQHTHTHTQIRGKNKSMFIVLVRFFLFSFLSVLGTVHV